MQKPQMTQQLAFNFDSPAHEAPPKAQARLLATLTLTTSFTHPKRQHHPARRLNAK